MKRILLCLIGIILISQPVNAKTVPIVKNINATVGISFLLIPLPDTGMNTYYYASCDPYTLSDETAFIISTQNSVLTSTYYAKMMHTTSTYYRYTIMPTKPGIYSFKQTLYDWYDAVTSNEYNVTYNINVVDITDILLESNVEVQIGDTYTLKPQLVPGTATTSFTWSSLTPQVATVSDGGVITANAIGNATITCMAHNGITSQCKVKVNPILINDITLNETDTTMLVGEELQLEPMIVPENATDKSVIWSSTNDNVALVDEKGFVTAVGSGICQIKAIANDGSGKIASCIVKVEKNNKLTVTDMTQCSGGRGVLNILLTDEETIMGFQFDLELPEGITVAENEGQLIAELTGNAVNTHNISANKVSENLYCFVVTPQSNRAISNDDGGGMTITIDVADDVAVGIYKMTIKDIEMTVKKAGNVYEDIHPKNSTASLAITEAMMGDVNGDGRVSVTDVISMNSYILEEEPAKFIRKVADMNGDGKITITDLVHVIDIILGR
ncbi:MAG: Ig-like domain-containing protein [Bacteroidaceae bacterium]|nr:Ig-like domain-containing protein [Bacteroidaceae bacterium]